jgi:hypothetical protein
MRLWFVRLVLFVVTALPANALTKKVLIIGIDGTMPSALAVAQTPNLNALNRQRLFLESRDFASGDAQRGGVVEPVHRSLGR